LIFLGFESYFICENKPLTIKVCSGCCVKDPVAGC
jgi:hypothetical protein